MSEKKVLPIGAAICLLAGAFMVTANDTAGAAPECLAGPNRPSSPGTHWHYRINHTTKQRCWYLKQVGSRSRPRPTATARAAAAPSITRPKPAEAATSAPAPAESESSIKAWFAATFSALAGSTTTTQSTTSSTPEAREPSAKRRSNATERPETSKSERLEQSRSARAQHQPSAAATAEAAGDKEIAQSPADGEAEWQRTLFEEFLRWRVMQELMAQ